MKQRDRGAEGDDAPPFLRIPGTSPPPVLMPGLFRLVVAAAPAPHVGQRFHHIGKHRAPGDFRVQM